MGKTSGLFGLTGFGGNDVGEYQANRAIGGEPEDKKAQQLRDWQMIDVDAIEQPALRPRTVYLQAVVDKRAKSLDEIGQQEAIKVRPKPGSPGRYYIIEGWTRVLGTRQRGEKQILAEICAGMTDIEAAWSGYHHNEQRSEHYDVDRGLFFSQMLKVAQSTIEQMASQAGIDRTVLQRLLSFGKLSPEVIAVCIDFPAYFNYNLGYMLRRLDEAKGSKVASKFALEAAKKNFTRAKFGKCVEALIAGEQISDGANEPMKPVASTHAWGSSTRYSDRIEFVFRCDPDRAAKVEEQILALLASVQEG